MNSRELTIPTALQLRAYHLWHCYCLSILHPAPSRSFTPSAVSEAGQALALWIGTHLVWEGFDYLRCHQWRLGPTPRRQFIKRHYCVRCCGRCDVRPLCCCHFSHQFKEKENCEERGFKSMSMFRGMHLGMLERVYASELV